MLIVAISNDIVYTFKKLINHTIIKLINTIRQIDSPRKNEEYKIHGATQCAINY